MKPQKTVLLGMSGGVDSSVAALILQKKGYKVIGAFMKNFSDTKNKFTGQCWWQEELSLARTIANKLNIPLYVLDYEKEYKNQVIKPMIQGYAQGITPNPDIECNNLIKFPALWKKALELKADYIATGHYAKVKQIKKEFQLLQGKDKTKDQSYFLYKLTREDLSHTLFPLGNMTKKQVREIAKKNKFPNWDKHGSAGVCFIGNVPLREYLNTHIKSITGKVLDTTNKIIGTHQGTSFYTIGQKASPSIGIIINKPKENAQERYYVSKKEKNNLIVAPEGDGTFLRDITKIKKIKLNAAQLRAKNIRARIRHLGQLNSGKLIKKGKNYFFKFSKPIAGLASGQSIVLYQDQQVIAGGEMEI